MMRRHACWENFDIGDTPTTPLGDTPYWLFTAGLSSARAV